MSFSTSRVLHPAAAVAAPDAPITLRKVRLFIPSDMRAPQHASLDRVRRHQ
jgi:hypothetical protein